MAEVTAGQLEITNRLLELGQQIVALAQIVSSIDRVESTRAGNPLEDSIFAFDREIRNASQETSARSVGHTVRGARPPLPDPRLVRQIIRQRQKRTEIFKFGLFADPAWDMLLDLTAARVEHKRISITSLCIASGVPSTTALRWISQLVESGLAERIDDDRDRRRAFISLSDAGADLMAKYFDSIGDGACSLV